MAAKSKPSKRQKVSARGDGKRFLDDEASEDNEDD